MLAQTSQRARSQRELIHQALIYESVEDFVEAALPFVRDALAADQPVLVRVRRDNADALAASLGDDARRADIAPAEEFYDNPSRTRERLLAWVGELGDDAHARVIAEPPWPLGSDAGIREWERYESVVNVAFSDRPVSLTCSYDARSLPGEIVASAESTHPAILCSAGTSESAAYEPPEDFCDHLNAQTPVRTGQPTLQMPFDRDDLRAVRDIVEDEGSAAGLAGVKLLDMMLAVDEVATNAIVHGSPAALLKLWRKPGELIWEVSDTGPGISDPLAGQIGPDPSALGGRGLWMARMICDSLEFRSDGSGTVVALYVSLPTV